MGPTEPHDHQAGDARLLRHALWILAGTTVLRLVLGAVVPLFPDEMYYWDWSRRLQGGYFDHPPMIAVLIAGGTAILGDTPLGVRLLPILFGTLAGLFLVRTATHLAGAAAGRFAAVIFAVMPLAAAGLVLATPDAPLLAFLAWTVYCVVRALDSRAPISSTAYWVIAGLAVGLAMASKFTGVFFPMAIVLAMVAHRGLRERLTQPGPWLAVVVASIVMIPVLWWNSRHDWIAFRFQLGHGLGAPARGSWIGRELELIGGQLGLVTPILLVLMLAATWQAVRDVLPRRGTGTFRIASLDDSPARFTLAVITLFCCAFFMYSATRRSVEANWPAIAWVPAIVLLAAARGGPRTAWERRGVWLAGALTTVALAHVVVPFLPLPARRDQVSKAHGWEALASAVDSARRELPAGTPVAANRYQDAATLAFHLADHAHAYSLNLGARRNQYDLWPRFSDEFARGATLLLVLEEPAEGTPGPIRRLDGHFASVEPGPLVTMRRGGEYVGRRRLWVLDDWAGTWPADSTDPRIPR